ncbi:MAG: BlaI/MecI/CopY family transcriptional regulator [Gemmatimonadaceae bacterium]
MARKPQAPLSRREREIMEVVYRAGSVTANDVVEQLASPPSYSAVRAMLRILEEKGHLTHTADGPRYVYSPVVSRTAARNSALSQVLGTFFEGSTSAAVAALLDLRGDRLSAEELEEIERAIERARQEGR